MQSSPNPFFCLFDGVRISVGKAEGFHWLRNEAFFVTSLRLSTRKVRTGLRLLISPFNRSTYVEGLEK